MKTSLLPLFLGVVFTACGGQPVASAPKAQAPTAAVAALMLKAEPANAIGVVAAKAKAPAEQVTVTGRIQDITTGYAVLKLMDLALPYCGEKNKEEQCRTPWDYCCEKPQMAANSLLVESRGADGKPVASPSLGDLRLLDRITVTGKLERDEHGNYVLLASGWWKNERPSLPDYVKWPQ
jgi:hypothetical protein